MAQREPLPKHRLPSTEISPSVEDAIERTWPSDDDLSPPAETPDEIHARVRAFFVEVFDNNRKLQKISRARIAQAQAQTQAFLKAQALIAQPPPPQAQAQPQPDPKPKPKRQKAGLSPLEILGITAASVGAVVLIGKAVSAYSESKRPRRRLALGQADDDTEETSTITFNHTTHSTVIDADAIEAMTPKLQSFVSEAVSKNFDEGKAVQHVHLHQHTQHVHPVTKTERIVERSVPGPKGDKGDPGGKGNKGDPGKSTRGPRGHHGKQGKPGTVKRVTKTRTRTVPLRGAQPKTSKGLLDD